MRKNNGYNFKSIVYIFLIIMLSSFSFIKIYRYNQQKKELIKIQNQLIKELQEKKRKEVKLSKEAEKLKNNDYAIRYLKEKFMYSKKGEYIIKLPRENVEA